ncbi:hypothetical protein DI270_003050 [Microbispora triticiradicis]|uniref:Uncharacterized protein n=1 Tax=Microbispora triticiradicis TaxID=2200763 RepID=A0ABX9LR33_9ACTN|nr:hypothetical protein [Microbispora triticiradicis]RGA06475.1 hypothetical protein DI270_003050 [Microbispora triticiradicis]
MVPQDSPLLKAARLCLADVRAEETAIEVADVLEYLKHDEWEMALLLLEDLGDAHPQPPEFWSLLADAARLMWLMSDVAWYEWRHDEARNGGIRAELCLVSTENGSRATPIPPCSGILRPMWDIGHLTPAGEPLLSIARLWVEGPDPLEPGGCSAVRLLPMTFEHWRHLKPGDPIMMHERRPPAGTARVIEILQPVTADAQPREA